MTRSESVNELAAALAKAQGDILNAKRDAENPHFRSRYADLGSVWDAIRAALSRNGLSIVQSPRLITTNEKVWLLEVETSMLHQSGQYLSDVLAVPLAAPTAQGIGSATTYARRYALAAFAGVAAAGEDDDGNAASEPPAVKPRDELETVTVQVLGIVKRAISNGKEKFVISADDKQTYQTFSVTQATTAKDAKAASHPVEITYKTTQYGRDIVALADATLEEPPI
jgi:hypothetical protein